MSSKKSHRNWLSEFKNIIGCDLTSFLLTAYTVTPRYSSVRSERTPVPVNSECSPSASLKLKPLL